MTKNGNWSRRNFIAAAGAGVAACSFSIRLRAEVPPVLARLGYLADTFLDREDDPRNKGLYKGWLLDKAREIGRDLLEQIDERGPAAPVALMAGEVFIRPHSDSLDIPDELGRLAEGLSVKPRVTLGDFGRLSERGYALGQSQGAIVANLATDLSSRRPRLAAAKEGLAELSSALEQDPCALAVLLVDSPLSDLCGYCRLAKKDRELIMDFVRSHPRVVLVMCAGSLANRVEFIDGAQCLLVHTGSAVTYPCGARLIEIDSTAGGGAVISGAFIQSRLLDLVERGFHEQRDRDKVLDRVGSRPDRFFVTDPDLRLVQERRYDINPSLAPWWKSSDQVNLAVLTDTHLCLDRHVPEDAHTEYGLIGHFTEQGSRAIYSDILDQVAEGRHRVEFYDKVFSQDSDDDRHYLERDNDALLITGDLAEHGQPDEEQVVLDGLGRLPEKLRKRTILTFGNHDLYQDVFAPRGPKSDRQALTSLYSDYLPEPGKSTYVAELSEWLSLIVLDSAIGQRSMLGLGQERIDWLEDQVKALSDKTVMIACHHPLYSLTLVPPLMRGYMRLRAHFTAKDSATRRHVQRIFRENDNVKLIITGHYHGVVTDQFDKNIKIGPSADDGRTTHIQVPCTIEYPNGYRIFSFKRSRDEITADYNTCYTRHWRLRQESGQAPVYRIFGTRARVPRRWEGSLENLSKQDNILGHAARLDPYDLADLNVRGFKDGTARMGKGKGGRPNVNGRLQWSV